MPSVFSRLLRPRDPARLDLTPSAVDRLISLARPNRVRSATARKVAALILAILGIALLFRGDPDSERISVVTAARDIAPGKIITPDDLGTGEFTADQTPDGVVTDLADVLGRTVVGPIRRGETVTDIRILGSRSARESTGIDDARIVPVRLADAAVADILRSGDIVDVLTVGADTPEATSTDASPRILASGAVVVLVTAAENASNQREQIIMLALPTEAATRVAGASLVNAITVTFQ
ncbi:SAF domain-containing protein [Rhodococcus sp. ARC_M6]|uniref:SAF domain-containing protein n=1 Tax=Rhodococcus sp. ARC_M6 TaxID=2928852 RepID=UPI001FB52608|nr:SAF domain-containing protein [Rhodococcus sp. ARC_M6]MCJ0905361.1 SAF domain-containing protein [Rhodococcus sp. ARC_M6]